FFACFFLSLITTRGFVFFIFFIKKKKFPFSNFFLQQFAPPGRFVFQAYYPARQSRFPQGGTW
ncbi:hypothetical protein NJH24_25525, partial [Pseudomonas asiatica]|uniref:hypothetical protein n=1 Tax=Pseudomonas asiatica TaxID=2219225 RepID=UPI00209AF09F